MRFIDELYEFLYADGFRVLRENAFDIWGKQMEDKVYLLKVVPERLPGQTPISLADVMREQEELGRQWMVRSGNKIEWLTLVICKGEPSVREREGMNDYKNIWYVDYLDGRVIIYETQRGEYIGLKVPLEEFLEHYKESEREAKKLELKTYLTPVNTTLILINVAVFFILSILGDTNSSRFMAEHGAMVRDAILEHGEWYRIMTAMFLHFGGEHLLQNMFILFIVGSRLENIIGRWRYLLLYLLSGIVASFTSLFVTLSSEPNTVAAGASGAIFGVMGATAAIVLKGMFGRKRKRIEDIGLIGIFFMVAAALSYGFFDVGVDNAAHIGGLIAGLLIGLFF